MKRVLLALAILSVITTLAAMACGGGTPAASALVAPYPTTPPRMSPSPPPPAPTVAVPTPDTSLSGQAAGGTPFTVNLEDIGGSGEYKFDPTDMTFSVGETVTFTLTSESEYHTFEVDELEIFEEVEAGDLHTFTFTFNEAGTYELVCTPHLTQGMIGTITVQ